MAQPIKLARLGGVLTSHGVRDALHTVGTRIANETRGKTHNEVIVVDAGKSRARVIVRVLGASAAPTEVLHRPLGSSVHP